ncbi:hypothetical protein T22_014174 [Escherichia coli O157:H43 str. T22]|nr:hypothetical protein T22_014174 [Escherichia coli O157:H43 str. T22]
MPDALRLSGLRVPCNILNLHDFVGRIRRSCRIRHKQSALCQKSRPALKAGFLCALPDGHFVLQEGIMQAFITKCG